MSVTLTRYRHVKRHSSKVLAERNALSLSSSNDCGTAQFTHFGISIRSGDDNYSLRFDREQAERVVKYLTEQLQRGPEVQHVPHLRPTDQPGGEQK